MKTQLITLFLFFSIISIEAFAKNNEPEKELKKTQKSKYDFNIFKLNVIREAIELNDSDSLKIKSNFRKEN